MTDHNSTFTDTSSQSRIRYEQPAYESCNELAQELGVPYLIGALLWQRGIQSPEKAREFLDPKLSSLPSPFLMKDMEKAVDLVTLALQSEAPVDLMAL